LQIKQANKEELNWGVKFLEKVATKVFRASQGWRPSLVIGLDVKVWFYTEAIPG
jgi:hypothetical protein